MTLAPPIHRDPDLLGGVPVFVGTRVPLKALLDYLKAGHPLDEFLDDFPSVTREQAILGLQILERPLGGQRPPIPPMERALARSGARAESAL